MTKRLVSAADLRLIAAIEGRPRSRLKDIARALGVSATTAWRVMARLERDGTIRYETAIRRGLGSEECNCVVYLQARLMDVAALGALETHLRDDASVWSMARITGAHDYRIQACHGDHLAANAWYRELLSHPAVTGGTLAFVRYICDRPTYGAALLEST